MLIVFIGPPGSGKGTQSKRLLKYLNIPHLSTGELLRWAKDQGNPLGHMAAQYMDQGRLAPDPIVLSMVGDKLNEPEFAHGCLFDGFPRTIYQAKSLDESLKQRGKPLDVEILEVDVRGDKAMASVRKTPSSGATETLLVKEGGTWKIATGSETAAR